MKASAIPAAAGDNHRGQSLDRLVAEGQAAWPTLALDSGVFRAYLIQKGLGGAPAQDSASDGDERDGGDDPNDAQQARSDGIDHAVGIDPDDTGRHRRDVSVSAPAADLFLACACAHGVPGAVEVFQATHRGVVGAAIGKVDPSTAFADDIRQDLAALLFVSSGEDTAGPPKIAQYSGRGPLATWTFVTVLHMARRRKKQLASRAATEESAMREGLFEALNRAGDPELLPLKNSFTAALKSALYAAIDALDDQDRLWLFMNVVEGVPMDRLGAASGASQSKVSRHIKDTKEQILREAKHHLRDRLKIGETECDSLLRLVQSQVDITLSRVFEGNER